MRNVTQPGFVTDDHGLRWRYTPSGNYVRQIHGLRLGSNWIIMANAGRFSLTGDFHGVWHTRPFETIAIAMRAAQLAEESLRRDGIPA